MVNDKYTKAESLQQCEFGIYKRLITAAALLFNFEIPEQCL